MTRSTLPTRMALPALWSVLTLPPLPADDRPAPEAERWGADHVGQPLPDFTSGDECLFCHRDVGPGWTENRHGRTLRVADAASTAALLALRDSGNAGLATLAGEVEFVMGDSRRQRFVKAGDAHGRLELLTVEWEPPAEETPGRLLSRDDPRWDRDVFGTDCAGCHTTGVDAATQRFAALSLDCFTCHGVVPEDHTDQPARARFSSVRTVAPREEMSVCGQCHLRGGRSRSSGLPYPNNFVAGDNLFLDYEVDLSDAALSGANPIDRHILENVRDVVLRGEEGVTCLTCHDVHGQSSHRHRRLQSADLCLHCHHAEGPKRNLRQFDVHSTVCGY